MYVAYVLPDVFTYLRSFFFNRPNTTTETIDEPRKGSITEPDEDSTEDIRADLINNTQVVMNEYEQRQLQDQMRKVQFSLHLTQLGLHCMHYYNPLTFTE